MSYVIKYIKNTQITDELSLIHQLHIIKFIFIRNSINLNIYMLVIMQSSIHHHHYYYLPLLSLL